MERSLLDDLGEPGSLAREDVGHLLQLRRPGLQLLVGGFQLLVGGLQLLVVRLQLLVGRLQLLVRRLELLVGGLQLLLRQHHLLVGGLQLLVRVLEILVHLDEAAGSPRRARRRAALCSACTASQAALDLNQLGHVLDAIRAGLG